MRLLWISASIVVFSVVFSNAVLAQSSPVTIILLDVEKEYVLIKNTSDTVIDLNGWVLHDHDYGKGSVYSYTFSELILQPGSGSASLASPYPYREQDTPLLSSHQTCS